MLMCPEDVCKTVFGKELTENTISLLQMIREVFGVTFKLKPQVKEGESKEMSGGIVVSCLGLGAKNMARRVR